MTHPHHHDPEHEHDAEEALSTENTEDMEALLQHKMDVLDAEDEFLRRNELAGAPDHEELEEMRLVAFREAAQVSKDWFKRREMFIQGYGGDHEFARQCTCLAMGWADITGVKTGEELAKRFNRTKQAASKVIKQFQRVMGIAPMPGQRTEDACTTFRDVRRDQLEQD